MMQRKKKPPTMISKLVQTSKPSYFFEKNPSNWIQSQSEGLDRLPRIMYLRFKMVQKMYEACANLSGD